MLELLLEDDAEEADWFEPAETVKSAEPGGSSPVVDGDG